MKKALCAFAIIAVFTGQAYAVDKWWDTNGTIAGSSGGTSANGSFTGANLWNTDSTGGTDGALSTWTSGTGDVAHFSAGTNATGSSTISGSTTVGGLIIEEGRIVFSGTITVNDRTVNVLPGATLSIANQTQLPLIANNTINLSGTYELTNPGPNSTFIDVDANIVLGAAASGGGNGTFSYDVAGQLTIFQNTGGNPTTISGPGAFVKEGAGILALGNLAANNTWTGGTIINNGELRLRNNNNELPTTTEVTINNSGILNLDGRSATIGSLSSSSSTTLVGISGATAGGTLTINGTTSTTYAGVIADITGTSGTNANNVANLTKNGGSTLTLTGANTYTGATTLGNQANNVLSVGNGGTSGSLTTSNVSIPAMATLVFNRSDASSYNGDTSGAGTVIKEGAGTLTISNNDWGNTGGVVINGGTIQFGNSAAGFGDTAPVTINNGAVLDMNAANDTFGSLVSTAGNTTGELRMGIRNLTLGQTGASPANRTYEGTITGTGTLTKGGGTFTQVLSGNSSTYDGNIVVNLGKISVGHANALGTTVGNTQVASGAEVLFAGATTNFTINEAFRIAGNGAAANEGAIAVTTGATPTIAGPVSLFGDTTLTVSGVSGVTYSNAAAITSESNQNLTLAGGAGAGAGGLIAGAIDLGTGSLTKEQGGTWELSGDNDYSGGTNVNAGTLVVSNTSGSGTGSGAVTVAAGATIGGSGTIGGPLSLSGVLAPGTSAGTLSVTDNVVLNAASQLAYELTLGSPGQQPVGGANNDLLAIVGGLTLGNATQGVVLNVDGSIETAQAGDRWTLITYTGGLTMAGPGIELGTLPDLTDALLEYVIDFSQGGEVGLLISSTAVPEAGSFIAVGLVGLVSGGAVWLRKRMRPAVVEA